MSLSYNISKEVLDEAIRYYEAHGVVTQRTTKLGRGSFRKLLQEMESAGCSGTKDAIETELVIGNREDYFEVIYNAALFPTPDEAKDYILKHNL